MIAPYSSYYPTSYNPYPQTMPQYQQPQNSGNGITWVQGEAGAKAFSLGAGQSVLLMDSENAVFYIKSTDGSGMPSLRIFDYTERTAQNARTAPQSAPIDTSLFVTRAELDERLAALTAPVTTQRKEVE